MYDTDQIIDAFHRTSIITSRPWGARALQDMGLDIASFGKPHSKEQMLKKHQDAAKTLLGNTLGKNMSLTLTTNHCCKPAHEFPEPPALEALTPIRIANMMPGISYRWVHVFAVRPFPSLVA